MWREDHPNFEIAVRAVPWRLLVEFARTAADMTQYRLAESLSYAQSTVSRLESPRHVPNVRTLAKVAAITGAKLTITMERGEARKTLCFDGALYADQLDLRRRSIRFQAVANRHATTAERFWGDLLDVADSAD